MKVCLISGEYPPMRGGVADYTSFLGAALRRYGVETTIVTSEKANVSHSGAPLPPGPDLYTVPTWGDRGIRRVLDYVAATRPDIVHIQYQAGAFELQAAINTLPLRLRLRANRPRVAVTFHDLKVPYLFPKAGPLRQLATTALLAGSDAVFTTNAEDAARLAFPRPNGHVPRDGTGGRAGRLGPALARVPIGSNIPVAPPSGFDRAQWRDRLGVGPDHLLLSYFGFLVPTKGVDVLIAALRELRRRDVNVKLAMIGGSAADLSVVSDRSYEHRVRLEADEPALRGSVLWTGFTAREEVSANLLASDVCVLPFREGASLRHGTLVAAITHGLPVVTTTPPTNPTFLDGLELRSGENCLLTTPGEVAGLVSAIESLARSAELRANLAAGAAALREHFQWDTIARQTLRVYQGVLGESGSN